MELPINLLLRRAGVRGEITDPVASFLALLEGRHSERWKATLARDFYHAAALSGMPLVHRGLATFMYYGPRAHRVTLAGSFNNWNAERDAIPRVGMTGLWLLRRPVKPPEQYKLVVDGKWKTDPATPYLHPDGYRHYNSLIPSQPLTGAGSRLVAHPDLYSRALRNRRALYVYLPPGYMESSVRYPVLYLMDGHENLYRANLPALFDRAIAAQELPPLIGVFIPHAGRSRGLEYTPYFKRSRQDAYLRFMAEELVPFIDATFRTLPDRAARTLLGQSFGGTIVTSLAIRYPEVFRQVVAQSGVYVWPGGRTNLTPFFTQPKADLRFYVDCVPNRFELPSSRMLIRTLKERGYPYVFVSKSGKHEYEIWQEQHLEALRYLWFDLPPAGIISQGI